MSLIERWWLIVGPDGHAFEVCDEQPDPILGHGQPFKDRVVEVAPAEQLRGAVGALHEAIQLARDFNRGAMTWQEYDRKLAALEVTYPQ